MKTLSNFLLRNNKTTLSKQHNTPLSCSQKKQSQELVMFDILDQMKVDVPQHLHPQNKPNNPKLAGGIVPGAVIGVR
jgi:hypothetical protein